MIEPSETIIQALPEYYVVFVPDDENERDKIITGSLSALRMSIIAWRIERALRHDGTLMTTVYPICSDGEMSDYQEYVIQTPSGQIEHPEGLHNSIVAFMKDV